ncbi:hypothetical protein NDU88_004683 [Pleurodeles waltl]|uniref:Uncharacterized protein n=1 Tax=Pleurodeles waltl TaxID=8319 RepID=A0AAV7MV98_PLEWA|nr:hypothetical protein NDU88_004683 [Pleurodeles waltl]
MDSTISMLAIESKFIRSDIASFQSRMMGLERRVTAVEDHLNSVPDREQELLSLCSKLIDLEDRSHKDNVRFFGFPERIEGPNIQAFLQKVLPVLTGITFDPPLEFQRAHRLGSKRQDGISRPRPIIACLLRHTQVQQLLMEARTHGPFCRNDYEVHIAADFSKETNDSRKAFLAFWPRLRQLEVKYGLFEPARKWICKNGQSKDFYNPEDLHLFLDGLTTNAMDMTSSISLSPSELGKIALGHSPHIHQWIDATVAMAQPDIEAETWRDY